MSSSLRTLARVGGGLVALVLVAGGGTYVWADSTATAVLATTWEVPPVDFPVPTPLSEAELAELRLARASTPATDPAGGAGSDPALVATQAPTGADAVVDAAPADPLSGLDLDALARERAIARGKHLVETRYGCIECHGADFGGGTMVDDPAVGGLFGPNLTLGEGSVTKDYAPKDWDRIVRHGVKPDGSTSMMPAIDFARMSDQELSDIVTLIRSMPPVDRTMPAVTLGPAMKLLIATGEAKGSAQLIDHAAAHAAAPPPDVADATLGAHIAQTCTGCHGSNLSGGKVAGGDPSWPEAANLTPHATGLAGWTYEDFEKAFRHGVRKDGTAVSAVMPTKFFKNMTDTEVRAIWAHLSSLTPAEKGAR